MKYTLRQHMPLGNWVIYDETGSFIATVRDREIGMMVIEGLVLRSVVYQTGLQVGCWHDFHAIPGPQATGWQMICDKCSGVFGALPPTQQDHEYTPEEVDNMLRVAEIFNRSNNPPM